jgi:hypothetical protein
MVGKVLRNFLEVEGEVPNQVEGEVGELLMARGLMLK